MLIVHCHRVAICCQASNGLVLWLVISVSCTFVICMIIIRIIILILKNLFKVRRGNSVELIKPNYIKCIQMPKDIGIYLVHFLTTA